MNNTVNKPNTHAIHLRACLLSFIPKRNAEHVNVSDVLESMNRFHSENKKLEIVYDFTRERSVIKAIYQDKAPNCLDAAKVIEKMRSMGCGVLIIPTFRTLADKPEICSDIMMTLHEANIRIISPYDDFDSKQIYDQATAETSEIFNDLRSVGIRTIGQIAQFPCDFFQRRLGKCGIDIWRFANGMDTSQVTVRDIEAPDKTVGHGMTALQDLENDACLLDNPKMSAEGNPNIIMPTGIPL